MKLAKLFLSAPIGTTAGPNKFALVPAKTADPRSTTFIVFEWPVSGGEIPFVTRSLLPSSGVYWNMGLWHLTADMMTRIDSGPFLAVAQTPSLAMQKLVRFAQDEWAPVARSLDKAGILYDQFISVWFNHPDVFYNAIARHRRPSLLNRQNFCTVLLWPGWNYRGRTMQQRVKEMEARGCGGGNLNAANLSSRARKLGLV